MSTVTRSVDADIRARAMDEPLLVDVLPWLTRSGEGVDKEYLESGLLANLVSRAAELGARASAGDTWLFSRSSTCSPRSMPSP